MRDMRVFMIGGTRFIGRAIAGHFLARGDEVTVMHRGQAEPDELAGCGHLHADRRDFGRVAARVRALAPDVVVDTLAMTRADALAVLPHLPDARLIVLSSVDVYRGYGLLLDERGGEPVPMTEESPVRERRYPYRGERGGEYDDYDKLDVEPGYLERGGTVLRLGFIYGEHDRQRREEFILRRVRAGRTRIPVGAGTWLMSRCYVGDVADAVLAAAGSGAAAGQVFNVVESASGTIADWIRQILAAAGHEAELVTVPDAEVPEDLEMTRDHAQHMLFDNHKARDLLGWRPGDPESSVAASVRWHLAHPPPDANPDFTADDRALEFAQA
jgi:nucleoside-diphosphate-sugar epimerase